MNEFDQAAARIAQPAKADPLDQAAAQVVQGQRQQLRSTLYTSLLANPDMAARAQRLGRQAGVPADVVERNLPEVQRNVQLDEFDRVLQNSPTVAQWLTDQANAKIAHDDVANLDALVKKYGEIKPVERTWWQGITEPVQRGFAQGRRGLTLLLNDLGVFDGIQRQRDEVRASAGMAPEGNSDLAVRLANQQRQVERFPVPANIEQGMRQISDAQTFGEALSAALSNPRAVGEVTLQSLGASAPALATAVVGSTAGPLGTAAGAGLGSFAIEYGNTLQDVMSEKGVNGRDPMALSAALGNPELMAEAREKAIKRGVPIAIFDALTAGLAGKLLAGAKPTALSVGSRAAGELGLQAGGGAAGEAVAQGLTGEYKPGDILLEALAELPTAVVEVPANYRDALQRAQAAEQRTQALQGLNDLAKASKVRARDADTFEQFVAQATEDGPVQDVFINAQTLAQSGVAEALAQVSPSVAQQLPAALAAGGDIKIPIAEYTARIAGTEYSQSLLDHLKTEPNGMSRAEAQEFMQNQAQELEQEVQRVLTERDGDAQFKAQADEVKATIKTQLDQVARFTPQVNDAYAAMVGNFYAVMGAKLGVSPSELFQRYPMRVAAEGTTGAQVLEQKVDTVFDWSNPGGGAREVKVGDSTIIYGYDGKSAHVISLRTPSAKRNKGSARAAMGQFLREADALGIPVKLESSPLDKRTKDGRLFNFYKSLGFEPTGKRINAAGDPEMIRQPQQLNQSAFHGTPYRGIEKFSTDKIGTGEGAQAYGWGLYFAGRKEIAEWYRTTLAEKAPAKLDGVNVDDLPTAEKSAVRMVQEAGGNVDAALRAARVDMKRGASGDGADFHVDRVNTLLAISRGRRTLEMSTGQLYAVEIPEDSEMLLWDKPLSEQPEGVREALNLRVVDESENFAPAFSLETNSDIGNGNRMRWPVADMFKSRDAAEQAMQSLTGQQVYQYLSKGSGGDKRSEAAKNASEALAKLGIKGIKYLDGTSRGAGDGTYNYVIFSGDDVQITNQFYQNKGANRGAFNPATNTITLLKNADLSTFLHESGHFFLETQFDIASRLEGQRNDGAGLSPGEEQILRDTSALLKWFGVESLPEWYGMDFEAKRDYHERFARGFEAYLFEGKSPSIELQGLFQRFRAWLLNVYRELKNLNVELTDEVRGVFDRMLATNEQIALAEQGRSMMPLFTSPEQAGMTVDEFAAYQALGTEATAEAIQDVQARTLRDLAWTRNARGREVKKLQRQAADLRREVTMEVRREVMSQPLYRAWQFLTGKLSADDKAALKAPEAPKSGTGLDPQVDSLLVAIAKLGGISRDSARQQLGVHEDYHRTSAGVFGMPPFRKEGGKTADAMVQALADTGYLPADADGKHDLRDLEDRLNEELGGNPQYSYAKVYESAEWQRPGDGVNLEALGAGRLDMAALREMNLPEAVMTALQDRKMTAKDGLHPDIVADMVGFTSGDELVRALADATPPKAEIEGLTDARMLERYGDLATPEAIEQAADRAIHNDARARFVATEANALAKATGQRKILANAARDFARAMIARLKVRDIRPGQYAAAEVRAAKAAEKASKSGDLVKAAAEKRNQLVQNYATRAAYDAQDEVEKGLRYLRKFESEGTRKGLDADYVDQIDALLERFDLRPQSLKTIDKRTALAAWVESQREAGMEPEVPAELLNEAFRTSYKNITVEEFRGLVDTVRQIEHLGRLKNRLLTAKENREFNAVKDEIVASIEANSRGRTADTRTPTTNLGRVAQSLKNFYASHIKAATWARVMDGGKDGGPMWEYFIRSANERGDMETTMRAEATAKLTEILAPVFKLGRMGGSGQFFPTINRSLNREARIALALNTGSQGNLQRLLGGEGWTEQQIRPVLESLTAAEWQAVQAVWDHFESYREQIGAKERRVYGREPTWVDPQPLTVRTADGQELTLRGGYYPIKYDPAASQRAEEFADAEGAKRQLQGAFTSATTRRSFTKTRAEEVSGRPLLYTLAGLYGGVNDVIHDLAWHEWLIDVNRLLRSKSIDTAIRTTYGPEVKQQLKTWAADIAEGERGAQNAAEMALGRLRQGVSAAGLGFNVMSAAIQITGFNQSIVRVGAPWIGRGIAQYIASPIDSARRVVEASSFMADRSRTQFRELNELRNRVQDETAVMRNIRLGTYFMMMRMQRLVDVPTWLGAYEKAIAEGNAEDRAVSLADQAVIDSQGSGMVKDLSAVERGSPALRLFTVFYSYMNTAFNMGVARTMTAENKARLAVDYLMIFTVPAVLGAVLKDALTPGGDGEDDLEKLARKLAAEQLSYLMGTMVVVREFGEAAKLVTGAEGVGRDYGGPAGLRVISDTFRFTQQAGQGEFDDSFRKASVNLIGGLTGLPAAQINRSITGTNALLEGETENPAAVLFGYQKK